MRICLPNTEYASGMYAENILCYYLDIEKYSYIQINGFSFMLLFRNILTYSYITKLYAYIIVRYIMT